uniref:Ubiquitin-activating enzyme E1 C-terminal domain-containing protein n=1 Tax=viral metagenome TaxID=1070528 RepID=A0A6C0ACN1_9ZZZZ
MTDSGSSDNIDRNLYSRQLYAIGEEAMKKITDSKVFISGMDGLGVEIAKNTILTGAKKVTVHDLKTVNIKDLGANYYLGLNSLDKKRGEEVLKKLSELNSYVETDSYNEEITQDFLKQFTVAVFVNYPEEKKIYYNKLCRQEGIKFIAVDSISVFGSIFVDFGDSFTVYDSNGEEPKEGIIDKLICDTDVVVKCIEKQMHGMSSGDHVKLILNSTKLENSYEIKVIDSSTFKIELTDSLEDFLKGFEFKTGEFKQEKQATNIKFKSYPEASREPTFMNEDFLHPNINKVLHTCFLLKDSESFIESFNSKYKSLYKEDTLSEKDKRVIQVFKSTRDTELVFTNSIIGGWVAQEVIKGCSGKFNPIHQFMYFEATDSISDKIDFTHKVEESKYFFIEKIFGNEFLTKLMDANTFVVGSGAIGCELLKNIATAGLSCGKGKTIVTDMDSIEKSNLNRQFLFREKDIGHMKSECATRAVKEMNPDFNVESHNNRVGIETLTIYNDKFFSKLNFVMNALDNIEARRFVDSLCLRYRLPLLESGTQGPKGNTQDIITDLTESYQDTVDPPEQGYAACTIKTFPNKIEHTIQWAKEGFSLFEEKPINVKKYLDNPNMIENMSSTNLRGLHRDAKEILEENLCLSFDDCILNSLKRWHIDYRDQIKEIIQKFPEDHKNEDGTFFWSGSKKMPCPLEFDINNNEHVKYVFAMSNLFADLYNINKCHDIFTVKDMIHNQLPKISETIRDNIKIAKDEKELEEFNKQDDEDGMTLEELKNSLPNPDKFKDLQLNPLEFEKDDDTNFHVDFITASSNMRALNYNIETVDRHKTKGIAGKIIPALATTTSIVAGLVCLEMCKIINCENNIEKYRNYFLNLAIPFLAYSEPGPAKTFDFNGTKFSSWNSQKIVRGNKTIRELIEDITKDISNGNEATIVDSLLYNSETALYMEATMSFSKRMKERMDKSVLEVIKEITGKEPEQIPIELSAVCTEYEEDDDSEEQFFTILYYPN